MGTVKVIVIIIVIVLAVRALALKFFAPVYGRFFRMRMQDSTGFLEFFLKRNPDIRYEEFSCESSIGETIRGLIFKPEGEPRALIVFTHGYNRSIENYLKEAKLFADAGFMVLFFDGVGAGRSSGESFKGLPQHIIDMEDVLTHVEKDEYLSGLPLLLFGHSWGGYAMNGAGCYRDHGQKAMISISAFNEVTDTLRPFAETKFGFWAPLVLYLMKAFSKREFGKVAGFTSVKGLANATCPVLVCQSRDDRLISFDRNFTKIKERYEGRENFTFREFDGRDHDMLTPPENDRRQLQILKTLREEGIQVTKEEYDRNPLVQELWELQGETDEELINTFIDFYNNALKLKGENHEPDRRY